MTDGVTRGIYKVIEKLSSRIDALEVTVKELQLKCDEDDDDEDDDDDRRGPYQQKWDAYIDS